MTPPDTSKDTRHDRSELSAAPTSILAGVSSGPLRTDEVANGVNGATDRERSRETANSLSAGRVAPTDFAEAIRACIGDDRYESWFGPLVCVEATADGDAICVRAGTPYLLSYLRRTFADDLKAVASGLLGVDEVLIDWRHDGSLAKESAKPPAVRRDDRQPSDRPIEDVSDAGRLSRFLVGESNRTAWSIARDFVASPRGLAGEGRVAYVYADHGLGKSHLVDGVGAEIRGRFRDLRVMKVAAWEFGNWLGEAIQSRTTPMFRARFRDVDVLLLESIEFFDEPRREAFHDGLLQTLVKLSDEGKGVFLTGLLHPRMMSHLPADLTTRLLGGDVARIAEPGEDLRRRLTRDYAGRLGLTTTPEAVAYIAGKFRRSVREIQGALRTLSNEMRAEEEIERLSQPEVNGELFEIERKPSRKVGITRAKMILGPIEPGSGSVVRLGDIDREVAALFGLAPSDLKGKSKARRITRPRQIAMYLARRLTPSAYKEIGEHFARNHSTVMSGERTIRRMVGDGETVQVGTTEWGTADLVAELEHRLRAG